MLMPKFIFLSILLLFSTQTHSLPLSTSSRWIIDAKTGDRVKLHCVNWAGHVDTMIIEGLDKAPLQDIVKHVVSSGFNCVRLTYATYMYTRHANITVAGSLDGVYGANVSLANAKKGIKEHNPSLMNLTLVELQEVVVDELGRQGLMVDLDNHVSKPQWCCTNNDGNGFFGDDFFDPNEWLHGLELVATNYKDKSQVVAMGMRNELRGPKANVDDWFTYITKGATTIHNANPNLIILISGLSFDTDFRHIKNRNLDIDIANKLVYEAHWYAFTNGGDQWIKQNVNRVCAKITNQMENQFGFLISTKNPYPLFISEVGVDQTGSNEKDNRFLSCFMAYALEKDLDWALWAFQGSYYLKYNSVGPDETYGLLDGNWAQFRNPKFSERYRLMQTMVQVPSSKASQYNIIFHPESGHCIRRMGKNRLAASVCNEWSKFIYDGEENQIRLEGTSLCIKAAGDGWPVELSNDCVSPMSKWTMVTNSTLHLAVQDGHGRYLCLQAKSADISIVFTKKCICLGDEENCLTNPQSQWFKFIPSNM